MNDYQEIWKCLIENVLSKNYDKASEIWEPKTRKVFLKNIKKFRKNFCCWKKVEYVETTSDDHIIIRCLHPKGLIARSILAFNQYRFQGHTKYGKLMFLFYQFLSKVRGQGYSYFNSFCGVLLKHFEVKAREFCSEEIFKKFTVHQDENQCYIGWSYAKSIIPEKICYRYEFDTFVFLSAIDYSLHISMLVKLDRYVKRILEEGALTIPKINIYFHAKLNSSATGIPKSVFVVPGTNDICIYHIRIKYDTLRHEMLHAVIHAATSSWPPLFFREGYAESYEHNSNQISMIKCKYPLVFLLHDSLFFDCSEYPPILAGFLVRYLISQFGVKKFFTVYQNAENSSVRYTLKKEYGLSIKELKKQAIKAYQYEMDFEEQ